MIRFRLLAFLLFFVAILSSFQVERRSTGGSVPADSLPLFHRAHGHEGRMLSQASGLLTLHSGVDNGFTEPGVRNGSGYLYIELEAARYRSETVVRLPLNLAIVLDKSGSMAGSKMEDARRAAKKIIDRLGPQDFVSIVVYDHMVTVVQPAIRVTTKDSIYKKIDSIQAKGATNLWGGTERGYEEVLKNDQPGFINRVLLLSDGLANAGLTHSGLILSKVRRYAAEGITLSAFGMGLEYNDVLMTEMAET
ncbi:MAG TPA: VWA domain-containing protein, partial [Chitinophagaceae bacterium]|nr:VWA domain-containing protein [Chitinophagaceae bacterium]